MKAYIVATNVEFTCIAMAKTKRSAVSKAKRLAKEKGYPAGELFFEAYPIEEFFDDECEDTVEIDIRW